MRWRRWALTATLTAIGIAGVVTVAGQSSVRRSAERIDIGQQQVSPVSDRGADAIAVAVRRLAAVGLLDPEGTLYDYRYAVEEADSWTIGFDAVVCTATEMVSSCGDDPRGDAHLVVEKTGDDFVITEAEGPMTEEQRAQLVGFRDRPPGGDPRWEFPSAAVAGPSEEAVVGVPLWIGRIPAVGVGSTCTPRVVGPQGETVWTGDAIDLVGPFEEHARAGQLQLQRPVPEGLENMQAEFSCETFAVPGWRVTGPATIAKGEGGTRIPVEVPVRWTGKPVSGIYSRCVATVEDAEGRPVGTGESTLPAPNRSAGPGAGPDRVIEILARVDPNAQSEHVEAVCELIHHVEYGREL